MKKHFTQCLMALLILLPLSAHAEYDGDGQLLVTIYSNLYEEDAEVNTFSIALGSTSQQGCWVDIDTGYGSEEFEVGYATVNDSTMESTLYTGKVSPAGVIRIYGEPGSIDYINASGCGATKVEFNNVSNLTFLNLEHNSLQSLNIDTLQNLQAVYLMDNPFTKETPLMIGYLPKLTVLEVGEIEYISPEFTLTNFPSLQAFDAYYTRSLKTCDPTQCPYLVRLSLDMTSVSTLDVSKNKYLGVLNVHDSRISTLDLSNNEQLTQLYANHSAGSINTDVKFKSLDLTHCPNLFILYAAGNNLETLDLSNNTELHTISIPNNNLRSLDLSNNTGLYSVNINHNKMDYATLPEPMDTWGEFYYDQDDMEVEKSYKVGDVIDLSSRVLRDGYRTDGALYYAEKDTPTDYQLLDNEYYDYADGKFTLKKAFDKQVFATFTNELFSEYPLYTTRFDILTEEDFNSKPLMLEFASNTPTGNDIEIAVGLKGSDQFNRKPLYVDFGDGNLTTFYSTSAAPSTPNIKGKRTDYGNIRIYTERDESVVYLSTDGLDITNVNLTNLTDLAYLKLKDAGLYNVDLSYNANLQKLDLSGNNLYNFSLKGKTFYYYKSMLSDVNLSNNNLDSLKVDDMYALKYLNLANNRIEGIDFSDADNLISVDVSNNKFESLVFTYSESMQTLNASNNNLKELYIPATAPMTELLVGGNKFDFTNIPDGFGLSDEKFVYAPQQKVSIAVSSPAIDLSSQAKVGDVPTTFTWKKLNGTVLTPGTDYTDYGDGKFKFLEPVVGETLYCVLENAAYPQFTGDAVLTTTNVNAIGMPKYEVASFTTTVDGETVNMSLAAAKDNTSVFIDWSGTGSVTQYLLGETYREFTATSKAGAKVKVYVDNEDDNFSVMSIYGVSMKDFSINADRMTKLMMLGLEGNNLDTLDIPVLKSVFELKLGNNNLKSFDFSKFPNLYYLSLNGNNITEMDLGKCRGLGWAYLGNNKLSKINFSGNTMLESLDLGGNNFTECPDFKQAPNIGQIWLNSNKLTNVDNVKQLKSLRALNIANNLLTFATLPLPQWNTYYYNPQADLQVEMVEGKVDLSSQASVDGEPTTYRWFIGKPTIDDETYEFVGEELIADEEYTVENGVTTFLFDNEIEDLVCVLQNENLPNIILYTQPVTFSPVTGIEAISASDDVSASSVCYNLLGQRIAPTAKGIVVKGGKKMVRK